LKFETTERFVVFLFPADLRRKKTQINTDKGGTDKISEVLRIFLRSSAGKPSILYTLILKICDFIRENLWEIKKQKLHVQLSLTWTKPKPVLSSSKHPKLKNL